jgi:hypothetical protein
VWPRNSAYLTLLPLELTVISVVLTFQAHRLLCSVWVRMRAPRYESLVEGP